MKIKIAGSCKKKPLNLTEEILVLVIWNLMSKHLAPTFNTNKKHLQYYYENEIACCNLLSIMMFYKHFMSCHSKLGWVFCILSIKLQSLFDFKISKMRWLDCPKTFSSLIYTFHYISASEWLFFKSSKCVHLLFHRTTRNEHVQK